MKKLQIIVVLLLGLLMTRSMRSATCHANAGSGTLLVDHYMTDDLLRHRWAVLVDCAHPDRPWTLREVQWKKESPANALGQLRSAEAGRIVSLVRAGDQIQLWRMTGDASIHLSGTALEAGAAGQTIRVRTGEHNIVLKGKVSGAGSVELLPTEKWIKKHSDNWSAQ